MIGPAAPMTAILGISAFYHDSAAALVVDGRVVAAAQEERFSRVKHDHRFPRLASRFCLERAGIGAADLDHVVFYEKPYLKFERILETHLAVAPAGFRSFCMAMPQWVHEKLRIPSEIEKGLGGGYRGRVAFTEHHESHAASAFFPSPFAEAAILTVDGVGEWASACIGHGRGNGLDLLGEMRFPHSLGLLYSAFTHHCGFRVNSGEYKLMGLAPFGEPRFAGQIEAELMDLKADGSFRLNMAYFGYCGGLSMTAAKFDGLFGGPRRRPEAPITRREADIAASIQKVTEKVVLRMAAHARKLTGSRNLCLAGGVALNCVANGLILREAIFDKVWIQPASGDAGGALGAALFTWHQLLGKPRLPEGSENQEGSLLGPEYGPAEIEAALLASGSVYRRLSGPGELCREAATQIAGGKVVGWMQGRMEFGPRALGNRSILGDPRNPGMQSLMNLKVKLRESFRPFAPVVLGERAPEYFEMRPGEESPYMLVTAPIRAEKLVPPRGRSPGAGVLDRIHEERSVIPAVTHVDGSARVQTVDRGRNPRLRELLERFDEATGCPVLINTSFNIRGEPVVCTPAEAVRCFLATDIDVLVIGDFMLLKEEQPSASRPRLEDYVGRYGDD